MTSIPTGQIECPHEYVAAGYDETVNSNEASPSTQERHDEV